MWKNETMNPMASMFENARMIASNMPASGESGSYTAEMFQSDFPQFFRQESPENDIDGKEKTLVCLVPKIILDMFLEQTNTSVLPSRWGSLWRYAAGLYVAHFSALYLQTYAESSGNAAQAANRAAQIGMVKSATMGDTSISYDNSAVAAGTQKWGTWNATQYGAQLITMARMAGMGGVWIG